MILGDHEGNVFRHAVSTPYLQDAFHELRFAIEILPGDGTDAFFDVGNLRGGIFGSAVEHGDGNHRGQIVGDTAGEEEIEAGVLIVAAIADVFCRMPGIDGGASIGCRAFRGISWRRRESAASIDAAELDLLDGIADAVATVVWIVFITSVRRF